MNGLDTLSAKMMPLLKYVTNLAHESWFSFLTTAYISQLYPKETGHKIWTSG